MAAALPHTPCWYPHYPQAHWGLPWVHPWYATGATLWPALPLLPCPPLPLALIALP